MTPARWRSLALGALWVQVAALLGTAAFSLWRSADFSRYFNAAEALIAALVMAWWTTLLGRAGFGAAALGLADRFQMKPRDRNGLATAGQDVRIPFKFALPTPSPGPDE